MVTFRRKFFLTYLIILLLFVVLLYPFSAGLITQAHEKYLTKRTQRFVASLSDAENYEQLLESMKQKETLVFFQVSLIDSESGAVIFESHQEDTESPIDQPEVEKAQANKTGYAVRYSPLFGQEMAYIALPFEFQGKSYILRSAFPNSQINELIDDFSLTFLVMGIAILIFFSLFSWLAFHYFTRPIKQITRAIRSYELGKEDRIPEIILDKSIGAKDEFRKLAETLNFLSTKIDQQIATLLRERNDNAAILDSLGEGVVAIDPRMTVVYLNQIAADFLGIGKEELLGKSFALSKQPQCHQLIHEAQSKGEVATAVLVTEKKPKRYLDAIVVPRGEAGAIMVLQDKTSLHKIIDLGRDLIANTSHELKTPITIIRGFAETLHDHPELSREVSKEITTMMVANCQRMDTLVKNLLALAAVDEGLPLARLLECDLVDLIEQAKLSIQSIHPTAKIEITTKGEGPFVLMADSDLFLQAVINLLDNAVKYSKPPAEVTILVERGSREIILHVSDKGMGIPTEALDHIFERFYAVDKSRSRSLGGSGLGLSIVERIVEKHQGKISVKSVLDQGTTFTLTFPI